MRKYCESIGIFRRLEPGHYFEFDGEAVANWKAGDYVMWQADVPHAASNIGTEDRYTLQITGTPMNKIELYPENGM